MGFFCSLQVSNLNVRIDILQFLFCSHFILECRDVYLNLKKGILLICVQFSTVVVSSVTVQLQIVLCLKSTAYVSYFIALIGKSMANKENFVVCAINNECRTAEKKAFFKLLKYETYKVGMV